MALLAKLVVRTIFSIAIVIIIVSGVVSITTIYDSVQAVMMVFAIITADVLIERYLSRERDAA